MKLHKATIAGANKDLDIPWRRNRRLLLVVSDIFHGHTEQRNRGESLQKRREQREREREREREDDDEEEEEEEE
jgi:hypothetical protein